MVYCVGLTGNIASGKSTVAQLFSQLGAEVISADVISRELTAKDRPATLSIIQHFGKEIILEDGSLNRRKLRELIFSNDFEKKWLEKLLHPLIRSQIEQNISQAKRPYCIIEIPLLIEKKLYPYLSRIILVTSPVDLQIARVMKRDDCSREDALAVLANQAPLESHMEVAHDVIVNDAGLEDLEHQVEGLHKKYLLEASKL